MADFGPKSTQISLFIFSCAELQPIDGLCFMVLAHLHVRARV